MGKKKKKLAKKSIKILQSGKIKINKNQKIDISHLIKDSVEAAVVSRLDGIITKEDVVTSNEGLETSVGFHFYSQMDTLRMMSIMYGEPQTIVITIPKKAALDAFDLSLDTEFGELLRCSTLPAVYTEIKEEWVKLNEDDRTSFTNVMYVPNVTLFLNSNGTICSPNMHVNVLLLAIPNKKYMASEPGEEFTSEEARRRVVADMLEASIRCGAKQLVIAPYGYSILSKDINDTIDLWNEALRTVRVKEQIRRISFAEEDANKYFNADPNSTNTIIGFGVNNL